MTGSTDRPDGLTDRPLPTAAGASRTTGLRWTAVVVVALAVGLAGPVGWWASRPDPQAGATLAEVRAGGGTVADPAPTGPVPAASSAPSSPAAPVPNRTPAFGEVTVRDAGLAAARAERDPGPVRLTIPALDVDATVQAVGVEDDGSMTIPAEIGSVGWYRWGAAPGADSGNAVLAGHVDAAGEGPGALFPLREIAVGTVVTVTDEAGEQHAYEVVGRETITKSVLPVDEIFARDGDHVLVIVTCGGPFQPELRSYRDNVVVTAVPVGDGA